nr:hypothetical protein Itr_chr06CG04530 [Ipomoea trifida]GMD09010.1 hypothetical protein Iba_chr06dCG4050 [Ipomoea batatas]
MKSGHKFPAINSDKAIKNQFKTNKVKSDAAKSQRKSSKNTKGAGEYWRSFSSKETERDLFFSALFLMCRPRTLPTRCSASSAVPCSMVAINELELKLKLKPYQILAA